MNKYDIFVISKGRSHSITTMRSLDRLGVKYTTVVEDIEFDDYASKLGEKNVLALPFSNLGLGSIPARNWVWDYSKSTGKKRHWILDDNIETFYRLHENKKLEVRTGAIFRAAEDFVDRFENVPMAGFNYGSFCKATDKVPPFYLNTRVYSCILLDNNIDYRWRGRYNEDTDLSIRILKDGYCTILFNAFLAGKVTTMRMKGGNTDTLYNSGDDRLAFAESLRDQHPDCVKVIRRFNRWHHLVDYRPFKKNELIKVNGAFDNLPKINNYGMVLRPK